MKTNLLMKLMNIIFWIIFIGLCIKTGAILISFFVSVFVNPEAAKDIYTGLDLSSIIALRQNPYIKIMSFLIVLTGMKAYLAFLAVKLFMKFDLDYPFNNNVTAVISKIAYFALSIGIVALVAGDYSKGLLRKGIEFSPIDWGAQEFLFFAGIIYILALVFKRGVAIQNENELTI